MEELDNLDGEETAILLIEDNEGAITRYGVSTTTVCSFHNSTTERTCPAIIMRMIASL